jgi:hypothetical protein
MQRRSNGFDSEAVVLRLHSVDARVDVIALQTELMGNGIQFRSGWILKMDMENQDGKQSFFRLHIRQILPRKSQMTKWCRTTLYAIYFEEKTPRQMSRSGKIEKISREKVRKKNKKYVVPGSTQ